MSDGPQPMDIVRQHVGRFFDLDPGEVKLPLPVERLVLPYVTIFVFGGQRLATDWLMHENLRLCSRFYVSPRDLRGALVHRPAT